MITPILSDGSYDRVRSTDDLVCPSESRPSFDQLRSITRTGVPNGERREVPVTMVQEKMNTLDCFCYVVQKPHRHGLTVTSYSRRGKLSRPVVLFMTKNLIT